MNGIGKMMIIIGIMLIIFGVLFVYFPKFPLGRLPGDIIVRKGNFTFYFPLVTSIILSIIFSIILYLFSRH